MGAYALADTIFGNHNKWGKLVSTIYPHDYISEISMDDFSMTDGPGRTYRYYKGKPLFPFGFGLSYTNFQVKCQLVGLEASCIVVNVGSMDGDEVLLVYHSIGDDIRTSIPFEAPIKSLINFERVSLNVNDYAEIQFKLQQNDLNIIDEQGNSVFINGTHYILFGWGGGEEIRVQIEF